MDGDLVCGRLTGPDFLRRAMARKEHLLRWGLVFLWMTLIFVGSTDLLSTQHTSRFIGPFLRWLIPGVTDETISWVQLAARKTAHATEYAALAVLFWRALNGVSLGRLRPWPARWAWWSWGLATCYAVTDEFHQSFVGSRQGQVTDVLIDSAGAAAGVGVIWWFGRLRQRWIRKGGLPAGPGGPTGDSVANLRPPSVRAGP